MTDVLFRLLLVAFLSIAGVALPGCERDRSVGDAVEDVGDAVGDAADDTADAVEDAVD